MTPDEYCQQKAAASGSSFYYSFLFLPPERRRAITALYAFCREVDDVVDEGTDPQVAAAKLAWWRAEVANLFAGSAQHPVTRVLEAHREKFGLSAERLN
jgi:15-cis-phytoene synthase